MVLKKEENHQNFICKTMVSHPVPPVTTSFKQATQNLVTEYNAYTKINHKIQCGPNGLLILRIFIF